MDTDNLSTETYKAIFYTSENYHHNLTLQFGLLASHCRNDNDFLEKANKLVQNWKSNLMIGGGIQAAIGMGIPILVGFVSYIYHFLLSANQKQKAPEPGILSYSA